MKKCLFLSKLRTIFFKIYKVKNDDCCEKRRRPNGKN